MTNGRIADVLEEIADLLEFKGANPFRLRAYRNGARAIRHHSEALSDIAGADGRSLTEIEGIGKDLATKIETLIETNRLEMHEELKAEIPDSVFAILPHSRARPQEGRCALQPDGDPNPGSAEGGLRGRGSSKPKGLWSEN